MKNRDWIEESVTLRIVLALATLAGPLVLGSQAAETRAVLAAGRDDRDKTGTKPGQVRGGPGGGFRKVRCPPQLRRTPFRKRRGRDSNPRGGLSRQQHFQCCQISRSCTSPEVTSVRSGDRSVWLSRTV